VKWTKNDEVLNVDYIEEEHLKFLIFLKKMKWQSIKGGNCDL